MSIEEAKKVLRENGYFVDHLFHVDEVKELFDCTDAQAHLILMRALTNYETTDQVNFSIKEFGEIAELKEK